MDFDCHAVSDTFTNSFSLQKSNIIFLTSLKYKYCTFVKIFWKKYSSHKSNLFLELAIICRIKKHLAGITLTTSLGGYNMISDKKMLAVVFCCIVSTKNPWDLKQSFLSFQSFRRWNKHNPSGNCQSKKNSICFDVYSPLTPSICFHQP